MKILDTTPISDTAQFPYKKGTLQFLQDAVKESVASVMRSDLTSNYNADRVYVLWGLRDSGTYPGYDISAGAVFYNNEVFAVDAVSSSSDYDLLAFDIVTTQYTTDADPVTLTDNTIVNMHNIRKMELTITGSSTNWGYRVRRTKVKRLTIPAWDMVTDSSVTVEHGLSDKEWPFIADMSASIMNDDEGIKFPLDYVGGEVGGNIIATSSAFTVSRKTAGPFNDGGFSSTDIDRGQISFNYLEG